MPRRRWRLPPLLVLPLVVVLWAAAVMVEAGPLDWAMDMESPSPLKTTTTTTMAAQQQRHGAGLGSDESGWYEVLVVPHSHCDAGYKKTVEGYYLTEVKRVLDSVVAALEGDGRLRFAWAEGAYLWRWWQVSHLCVGMVCECGCGCDGWHGTVGSPSSSSPSLFPCPSHQKNKKNRTPAPRSARASTAWCGRSGWSW